MFDTHTHSKFSFDSSAEPRDMIEFAIASGADYLAISDHLNCDFLFTTEFADVPMLDMAGRLVELTKLKEEYRDKITLAIGVECGFMPAARQMYNQILQQYPSDFILNSVHLVEHEDCYYNTFFDKRTKKEAYLQYLNAVRTSLDCGYDYDSLAHFGYVSRKATYADSHMSFAEFEEQITDILLALIAKGKALEINAHFEREWGDFLPTLDILKAYKSLGGELLTFGSDAHVADRIFNKYDIACKALKEVGFTHLFKYINHSPVAVKI